MTRLTPFATGSAALSDLDPYRFPAVFADDLSGEFAGELSGEPGNALDLSGFGADALPAPAPDSRLPFPLEPADRRRLELHAALTTAGIAPRPGDLDAIEALCALDDTTHLALQRWINRAP